MKKILRNFVALAFYMATEYCNNAKVNVVTGRWRVHFPTPRDGQLGANGR
jgi:hypothetical protein